MNYINNFHCLFQVSVHLTIDYGTWLRDGVILTKVTSSALSQNNMKTFKFYNYCY
jgi:hypothetical protein